MPTAAPPPDRPHARPAEEILAELDSAPAGLSGEDAAERLRRHGPNRLPEPPRKGPLRRFLGHFHNVLIYVLLVAAAVTALLGEWIDTAVILAVVIVNAAIGFIQEGRAEQAMAAIRNLLAPKAQVLRDGRRRTIPGEALVPGDIVLIEAGDRVPADIRLIEARALAADEAMLTGESVPVAKSADAAAPDVPIGDRHSMLWSGTMVTRGAGRGVVVATGAATEIGRIGTLLAGTEPLTTPLLRQIDGFARWLSVLIVGAAAALFAFGLAFGRGTPGELFMTAVAVAVAAIPEGLPAVITIGLAIGVQTMARRHAIVRRLPAIEAVGAVTVICTDKTGTLTRNEMVVTDAVTTEGPVSIGGEGYAPEGHIPPGSRTALGDLALAAALCNDAALHHEGGTWRVEGDPMEGALLAFAGKVDPDAAQGWQRTDAIPFDSDLRFMATLHVRDGRSRLMVKGAPERLLEMAGAERTAEGDRPLDAAAWHRAAEAVAARGRRVLALAEAEAPDGPLSPGALEGRLVLLGLVGLVDPPRPEAVAAVAECRRAGIAVKMITGDHAATAAAIAGEIGLARTDRVLTGADLAGLDDAALAEAVATCDVFARTSPEDKLRLVEALQARGERVAMTGDGVNDAPALRRADVGIAMGRKGSEAAKEASDLVLADDNFATIAAAVREGRTVFDNIRKVIAWTLPTNAGQALTLIVALILGLALPVTPLQILWVNFVTSVTLGLALVFEPTEPRTMQRPPRAPDAPLLSGEVLWYVVLVSGLFVLAVSELFAFSVARGDPLPVARTIALNTLVVLGIFSLFYVRYLHGTSLTWDGVRATPAVWITVLAVTAAQFAVTYLPPLQALFGTAALPLRDGLMIVATGAVFLGLLETEKALRLAWLGRRRARPA
ncbi:HAD-IC family P-type ATPase [Rubellimicrobium sp. CFH 75288]|uniref:HAD-IC family P-type ATPase n=1 Tax=Rubellimicrobium sp. CFH 75288 TaxID=2697034 RepID=UPI001411C3BB|nr:HAD-IC family P-type ATPase [Rubellimicrobium sp. CFH 75288]